MIKRFIPLLLLLLFVVPYAWATHIVGGQLYITQNPGNYYNYNIGLTMYFDALNGNPGAEDQFVNIYVFRKRDNVAIGWLEAPKLERKLVTYANPQCGISTLQTYMITYGSTLRLEPGDFNDPQGYYMVWDRCCRNGTITNIKAPGDAGSLFYLEFPPLVKNGTAFSNSSPVFAPIVGDYACVNSPFFFDFGGKDADGDSLTYTLITPMQGYSDKGNPSAPARGSSGYPRLTWQDGISVANIIPGPKPLSVNKNTGMLSVTPGSVGLYVFAVQVDEYRKGQKIGTLTRDFQLKVVDCPKMEPPKLLFKPAGKATYYNENEIITIKKNDPACFEVIVTDPSVNQLVKVLGSTVGQSRDYFNLLPAEFRTSIANDTLKFQVCLDECFVTYDNRPIHIQLLAEDESCPVPLTDTLNIYIRREGGDNNPPAVTTSLEGNYVHVTAGEPVTFTVYGKDADKDSLALSGRGRDFNMNDRGMVFKAVNGRASIQQTFSWIPPCNARKGDTLIVDFKAEDLRCEGNPLARSAPVYFVVDQSPNTPPAVTTSLTDQEIVYTIGSGEITFDVLAADPDTNVISLGGSGRGFDMAALGMQFAGKTGVRNVTSPYSWSPECSVLQGGAEQVFYIDFVTRDKNCAAATDTTSVKVTVKDNDSQEMPEFPNVITPNGDGKNDCFNFHDLPDDNCSNQFRDVAIFNRWGKQIYYSKDKSKDWCPTNISGGYYYYLIQYTKKSYKGGLTVLR
ncbi:T9SS type B sorting domain-containing protein [Dyadobacter sandarakinus]|uniref:Gliding motility-associated C-terminal domain-containing protein n=1 Tax=Dyadobacter sandarakinus TaxID=2747268 RepID=A0ABX7I2X4_9BACT|nr:gliding motility-associated C-terminal domain-containing protein [Dyadobacter sandarakinus]QRR00424.1 gliding motility-associated C-terminal domain-containing protein [Dyadobacter sandarakinus]